MFVLYLFTHSFHKLFLRSYYTLRMVLQNRHRKDWTYRPRAVPVLCGLLKEIVIGSVCVCVCLRLHGYVI